MEWWDEYEIKCDAIRTAISAMIKLEGLEKALETFEKFPAPGNKMIVDYIKETYLDK